MRARMVGLWALLSMLAIVCGRPSPASAEDLRAAILYFDYEGEDEELSHLRKGLTAMLIADLSGTPGVELVEREDLEKVLAELKLQRSRSFDKRSTVRIGKLLGARVLVTGRYLVFRGKMLVNAKIIDVETGAVTGVRAARPEADFLTLQSEIADQLRGALKERAAAGSGGSKSGRGGKGGKGGKGRRKARPRPAPPKRLSAEVASQYGQALDAMDRGRKNEARTLLKKVVKKQPDFALANRDLVSLAR